MNDLNQNNEYHTIQYWIKNGGYINKVILKGISTNQEELPDEELEHLRWAEKVDSIITQKKINHDWYLYRGIGILEFINMKKAFKSSCFENLYTRTPFLPCSTKLKVALRFSGNDFEKYGKVIISVKIYHGNNGYFLGDVHSDEINENLNEAEVLLQKGCHLQCIGWDLFKMVINKKEIKITTIYCHIIFPNPSLIRKEKIIGAEKSRLLDELKENNRKSLQNYIENEYSWEEWNKPPY
jgi:hypothetical protein